MHIGPIAQSDASCRVAGKRVLAGHHGMAGSALARRLGRGLALAYADFLPGGGRNR